MTHCCDGKLMSAASRVFKHESGCACMLVRLVLRDFSVVLER